MMLKKLLGTILCILVMVLGVICYMEFKSPASGEQIDDYLLSSGNGTYCGGTKTGSVELNIEIKGSGFQKMFPTSDDITKNGNHLIVDDRYLLRVFRGKHQLASAAYEQDSMHDRQRLKVYFTTADDSAPSDPIEIVISKDSEKNVKARIECALENDSKLAEFGTTTGSAVARVSSSGVYLDLQNSYFGTSDFQSVGSLKLGTKEEAVVMPLNNNVDPTKAKEYGMILPAVISQSSENTGTYAYAADLPDWQDISYLALKSAQAGTTWMVRKDLLSDLTYVSGYVVYQEDGILSIVHDNALYKAPIPESQKATDFELGTSVDIFYGDKIKQDYGYDLVDVTAIAG